MSDVQCSYADEVRARELSEQRQIDDAERGIVACPSCLGCGWKRVKDSETVDCDVCDGIGELSEEYATSWLEQRKG